MPNFSTSLALAGAVAAAAAGLTAPLGAQAPASRPAAAPAPAQPSLVVFITVDQMRPDYFDRFAGQLTGGFKRLATGGAFFADAHHDHAATETAPGHSVTMSGRFPRSTGIVRNNAGVQDPQAPLIAAPAVRVAAGEGSGVAVPAIGPGASPFRFRGTTLIDWLRMRDPRSRALSVSRKDRAAILPLGRAKQEVYWYGADGRFTTSTYYHDTLPDWVRRFDDRDIPRRLAGASWTLLLPDSAYHEPDSVAVENGGNDFTFPHRLPTDPAAAAQALAGFPQMDSVTLALALDGLEALGLGRGPQTDVLAVSLSTTDAVGHAYGPDSRELHDQVLRADRYLAAFFDSLYRLRDSSRIVVALTADHGVAPYPELHFAKQRGAVEFADLGPLVQRYAERLASRGVDSTAFDFETGMLLVDGAALRRAGVSADSVVRAFAADARRVPGVLRADFVRDLARADTVHDDVARRWYHSLPPDVQVPLVVTLRPYVYWSGVKSATHGSPHDYDTHVPVIFYGPPFKPGRYPARVRVVDMAPTLAAVLGVAPAERLDGRVLRAAIR
jgi:predicted AlkP superfamily pyrophosphatase or phosphodiesterase